MAFRCSSVNIFAIILIIWDTQTHVSCLKVNNDRAKLLDGNDKFNGEESKVEDITNSTVNTNRRNNGNNGTAGRLCGALSELEHGVHNGTNMQGYWFGDLVIFACLPGYHNSGQQETVCLDSGDWSHRNLSAQKEPFCQANRCSIPETPINGRLVDAKNITNNSVGTEIAYTCNEGYELKGRTAIQCQQSGHWDGQPPVCAEKKRYNDIWKVTALVFVALVSVALVIVPLIIIWLKTHFIIKRKPIQNNKSRIKDKTETNPLCEQNNQVEAGSAVQEMSESGETFDYQEGKELSLKQLKHESQQELTQNQQFYCVNLHPSP